MVVNGSMSGWEVASNLVYLCDQYSDQDLYECSTLMIYTMGLRVGFPNLQIEDQVGRAEQVSRSVGELLQFIRFRNTEVLS